MTARLAILVAAGSLVAAAAASAQKPAAIAPDSIVGVKLGMPQARAAALLRKPIRTDRLEDGYQRLVSGAQRVEVYFRTGAAGVVTVTTWSNLLRTDKHVGPCSSVAALKRAYGGSLKPFRRASRIVAYRSGNLIFTVGTRARVGVVALGRDAAAVYVALNAPAC
ncbi:MAG TPA: hypothetical protein VFA88_01565 [Gaiellaceae bacterium]|nr:hypothetical protein [Gaiellaceae bacterium]